MARGLAPTLCALCSLGLSLALACGGSDDAGATSATGAAGSGGGNAAGAAGATAGKAGTGGGSAGTGGASAGTGGASAGTGGASAGTGGSGGGTCPADPPKQGAPCAPEGLSCVFGACCAPAGQCVNGAWQVSFPPCAQPLCPPAMPVDGAACDPCSVQPSCPYDTCAQPGGSSAVAACEVDHWKVQKASCSATFACGQLTCQPGEVCVQSAGGPGVSYSCQKNPCVGEPLSCACAKSLCGSPPFQCQGASGHDVSCVCPICP